MNHEQSAPERLRAIKTLPSLIAYLRDELEWPIEPNATDDELIFDYDAAELGLAPEHAAQIKQIRQLRPLEGQQPWGIFWVNFEKKRLPVVMLRRILGHLVIKKRASANKAAQRAWHANDLLFISAYGEDTDRAITFAHFAHDEDSPGDLPVLKVLGWDDGDTVLHLADAHRTLSEKLRWPADPDNLDAWRAQWAAAFTLRHREVIHTTQELVGELARLATTIRRRADAILAGETDRGPMRRLYTAFKTALIHDLTEDDFADVIAQTFAYGLLAARFSRPAGIAVDNIVDMIPPTNPFLRELLGEFLAVAGRKRGAFDFDELGIQDVVELLNHANAEAVKSDFGNRARGEDPVIHFYEYFLKAYDKRKKVQRGVFYTPQPVVSYIVRSVHELLQTEFGLADGLADTTTWGEMAQRNKDLKIPDGARPEDPFVLILDPATGTATFLVEAIEVIFTQLQKKWKDAKKTPDQMIKLWNDYVPKSLLPRLYGYELMMAPYTIAHMKLGLKLAEIGARLGELVFHLATDQRAHIYLTNSLEPAGDDKQGVLEGIFPALAHEAAAVNRVKQGKRFTVVIGNPPYSGHSANKGPWITELLLSYKESPQLRKPAQAKWLSDDYVKFIRLSEVTLAGTSTGILGFITNHSYLDNPTFCDMRRSLVRNFPRIDLLDLHGSVKRGAAVNGVLQDENVFDIQQGVSIGLFTRCLGLPGAVTRADLSGSRPEKYQFLNNHTLRSIAVTSIVPQAPRYLFIQEDSDLRAEYEVFWPVQRAFGANGDPAPGIVTTHDDFAISWTEAEARKKVATLLDTQTEEAARRAFTLCSQSQWDYRRAKRELSSGEWRNKTTQILYRPFDLRWTVFDSNVAVHRRERVSKHFFRRDNVGLITCRQMSRSADQWAQVWVTKWLIESTSISNRTKEINYLLPLRIFDEGDGTDLFARSKGNHTTVHSGLSDDFSRQCAQRLQVNAVAADDVFKYAYSVFHSVAYRRRYAPFLGQDFPRLPLTSSLDLFRALAKLGGELVALHLMESSKLDKHITKWIVGKNPEVEKVTYSDETVWTDKSQSEGFRGVAENVWNFHIGGYQVCEKWLKDRKGRTLTADDIDHYHRIVVALSETIRLMAEIDNVIEQHGGWPGAFQSKAK